MKIGRKLSIWTLSSLVIVSAAALYAQYRLMITSEAEQFESLGNTVGPLIEESLTHSMLSRDEAVLRKTLANLEKVGSLNRILVLNLEGIVKAGTDQQALGKQLLRADKGYWGGQEEGQWRSLRSEEKTYRWVQAVKNRSECQRCHSRHAQYNGAIIIDFSIVDLEANVRTHILKAMAIFLIAFLCVGLTLFLVSNQIIIKRLVRIKDTTGRLKDGDYTVRVTLTGDDEITRLGEGFNQMAASIANSRRELEQYADELLALAVSSNVVTSIPRTENIYEAVCSLAVKELGVKMAWIGVLKEGSQDVVPAAQYGFEDGYLASIKITQDDSPAGMGPTGMAMKTKMPRVMNDIDADLQYAPWRSEALKRGYRSSLAMPLLTANGEIPAVMNFYSGEPAYFTRKRMRLFMIFANQVAAAIENRSLLEHLETTSRELADQFKAVSHSQQEWRLTFDSITDLISIHDPDFNIVRANRAFAEYFDVELKDTPRKKCFELYHRSCSPAEPCPHITSLREQRVSTNETVDPRTNRTFEVSAFPYYSPEGEFVGSVHIARDVTEVREKEMRLIMSERLASLGQMASGLAHEINNPLASIAGCAEGLLMKIKHNKYDSALFREYLTIIEEEIMRCKSITTGMLSFVRRSSYEKKEIDLNQSLDKTLEIIGFQGRLRDVTVVRNYQNGLPPFRGSEGELRQVFLALITNALDAIEDHGTLTIGTGVSGGRLFVKITDSGPGIPREHLPRIFDPFFTTKSDQGGTGLGLAIAHKITISHDGTIDVESQEGRGTSFIITLPKEGAALS